jgi:hypothetical protein
LEKIGRKKVAGKQLVEIRVSWEKELFGKTDLKNLQEKLAEKEKE